MIAALLLSAAISYAYDPAVNDIDIEVRIRPDGHALVTERWDVVVASGTEWYLVKSNLGAADILDFSVRDENGVLFQNIGRWDVDASIGRKAEKCGLNPVSGGYELCWGVGTYGPHKYSVTYRISDAVDLYDDYAAFHFQLVSPGLSSNPKHVRARVIADGVQLDTTNTRAWGFGFEGHLSIDGGEVTLESDASFRSNSSLIALVRMEKDYFNGGNEVGGPFSDCLERAMDGADFGNDDDGLGPLAVFVFFALVVTFLKRILVPSKRRLLGVKPRHVPWVRDVPLGGDLALANYVLTRMRENLDKSNLSSAFMLRMIQKNVLTVRYNRKGKAEFVINPNADISYMSEHEAAFLEILKAASGADQVLQDNEFSKWSRNHNKTILKWSTAIDTKSEADFRTRGMAHGMGFSPFGQSVARQIYGFKKFLSDFTLARERQSSEAVVWQDYLVYAALFGIADSIAKEMKDIRPEVYQEMTGTADASLHDVILMTRSYGRMVSNGVTSASVNSGASGTGGHTSFGGGGGFHGGGHGGGSR